MQIMPRGFDGGLSPAFGKGKCAEARRSLSVSLFALGSKADARRGLREQSCTCLSGREALTYVGSEIIGGPHAPKRFIYPTFQPHSCIWSEMLHLASSPFNLISAFDPKRTSSSS